MTKKYIDISDKIDNHIKGLLVELNKVSSKLKINILIVGAFARDLVLQYSYNIDVFRATTDFDFGIEIEDWNTYDIFINELLGIKDFKTTNIMHRMLYKGVVLVDLIPYGAIADISGEYQWRDKDRTTFNVTGLINAYNTACTVRINSKPLVEMEFASIESQAVLKLLSWNDCRDSRKKDAIDLVTLMINHIDAGNFDRFFDDNIDLATDDQISWENKSARLLGRDIAKNKERNILAKVIGVISKELKNEPSELVVDMLKRKLVGFEYDEYYSLVNSFYTGIKDKINKGKEKIDN